MFLLEPIRYVIAVLESLVVFIGLPFTTGHFTLPGDYLAKLNRMGIFENRAQESLPQTDIHGIILEHFENPEDGKAPKCLLIGYDGARPDALANTIDGNENGVRALRSGGGAVYNLYTGGSNRLNPFSWQDTSTAPGWTTMLTGCWAKGEGGHGVSANGINKAEEPKLIFTELLEADLTGQTAFVVSWGGHFTSDDASYKNDVAYCDDNSLNARWIKTGSDALTFEKTLEEVQDPDAGMVMCILEYCDSAGHGTGFDNSNPDYVQAIKDSERDGYALIQAVTDRPTYDQEDWLILITTDHGGVFTGHGPQFTVCRQVFLATNKPL